MKKILISGGSGQLAQSFSSIKTSYPEFEILLLDKFQLDITSVESLEKNIDLFQPDFFINCAAYTAVDLAETHSETAYKINVKAIENIGKICAIKKIPVIHFSSDYVYHNNQNFPLKEKDPTHPKGIYAKTKLEGELKLLESQPNSLVIRTSWVYSNFGKNFFHTILRLGKEKKELRIVADQIGTPTFAPELAEKTMEILTKNLGFGVYNYSPEGVCSWYDFAMEILEMGKISIPVFPISTLEFSAPAPRPHFSVMDKTKIKTTFGIEIPHWKNGLKQCFKNHLSHDSF